MVPDRSYQSLSKKKVETDGTKFLSSTVNGNMRIRSLYKDLQIVDWRQASATWSSYTSFTTSYCRWIERVDATGADAAGVIVPGGVSDRVRQAPTDETSTSCDRRFERGSSTSGSFDSPTDSHLDILSYARGLMTRFASPVNASLEQNRVPSVGVGTYEPKSASAIALWPRRRLERPTSDIRLGIIFRTK